MSEPSHSLSRLFDLVARLRGPDGCPWDSEQELGDLRAYLLEEAHEVAAAIDRADWDEIGTELGDLLFQVVFILRLAEESSALELVDVIDRIEAKMIARHPHVFGDETLADSAAVHRAWEQRKLDSGGPDHSLLSGIPESLPALLKAYRMTQKAAGVGFDWPDHAAVMAKVEEELEELRIELDRAVDPRAAPAVRDELGDLFFALANLARHLDLDPEAVLQGANDKFLRRFERMERKVAESRRALPDLDAAALDEAWESAKRSESD
jgi:MazG family protein